MKQQHDQRQPARAVIVAAAAAATQCGADLLIADRGGECASSLEKLLAERLARSTSPKEARLAHAAGQRQQPRHWPREQREQDRKHADAKVAHGGQPSGDVAREAVEEGERAAQRQRRIEVVVVHPIRHRQHEVRQGSHRRRLLRLGCDDPRGDPASPGFRRLCLLA